MAGSREPGDKPPPDDEYIGTWLQSLPVPEVKEGGDSMWAQWHEAARELDAAFGATLPSDAAPLSVDARAEAEAPARRRAAATVDDLMVQARRNNRACPRPPQWVALYRDLDGPQHEDLPPPPVDWIWTKLSALQKRLFFREYLEWADRHGQLAVVARFMDALAEADWLHVGED
jgi:hypothetical protein